MPGSKRTAAAKEVDAVFSPAAVAETRGSGGEGRQRATGVGDNKVDGRLGGGDGGSVRTRRRDQWRKTATSRPWRQQRTASKQREAADDAGRGRRGDGGEEAVRKQGKRGAGGSASASSRRKQWRRKRPRSMAATASWEGGTGGLMKTETRPTPTEKSEGREDPHVVGDDKEEEGERETAAATKFAEDPATASRRRKAVGFAVMAVKEEKATADGGGRGRRGRRDRGAHRWKRGRAGRRSRG